MDEIKSIIVDVVLKAVIARVVAAVPFLGLPIINPIFGLIAGWLIGMVADELSLMIQFGVIDLKVNHQTKEYEKATEVLKTELEKPKEQQDAKAIEAAKEEFKKKLSELIVFEKP